MIDTHAHLGDERFLNNINNLLKNATEQGVSQIISIGCSIEEAELSLNLAQNYPSKIYSTAGIYPHDNESEKYKNLTIEERFSKIETLLKNTEVKAIGECGLDYTNPPPHEKKRTTEEQKIIFQRQIDLIPIYNKPLIIHSRNATHDTLEMLSNNHTKINKKTVWHCFTEKLETATTLLNLGVMMSFTGIITYKNTQDLQNTIKNIPLENIMIETDCPYLVPEPLRSQKIKVNEPAYVKIVAQKISEIKGIELNKVIDITTKNAIKFFGL